MAERARRRLRLRPRALGAPLRATRARPPRARSAMRSTIAPHRSSRRSSRARSRTIRFVAPGKIRVAERQLNARLSAYGDALGNREGEGSGWHLGRALLEFAGHRDAVRPDDRRARGRSARALSGRGECRAAQELRRRDASRMNERATACAHRPLLSMPKGGLEPPRAYAHCALNAARLPIPPLRRERKRYGPDEAKSTRTVACRIGHF